MEMLNSANQAWTMYTGLSHGAYNALQAFGTPEQKNLYLPKLVSGEWTGTMCLTESQAAPTSGMLKSRAEPNADGSYVDHRHQDLHLRGRARPRREHRAPGAGAPAGRAARHQGISLFIVPKFLPERQGKPGARNGVSCGSLEHKMGIHGNATCVINLDGARGWMVGPPNKGLNAMFVMMNAARLGVGMQSLGLAEVAYQNSLAYAQGAPAGPRADRPEARRQARRPDHRAPGRAAHAADAEGLHRGRARVHLLGGPGDRFRAQASGPRGAQNCEDLVALLTPVVKGFITDNGYECTTLAMQVLGGHGYIAEWGLEQHVRDARINMIYEGTNTIQALDLLGRKVLGDMGARLMSFGREIEELLALHADDPAMQEFSAPLAALWSEVQTITGEIGQKAMQNPDEAGAAAVPYLRMIGHLVFSFAWCFAAGVAIHKVPTGGSEGIRSTRPSWPPRAFTSPSSSPKPRG